MKIHPKRILLWQTLTHRNANIYSFSWHFYPKRLTIAIYVKGRTPLEQLGVKCLTQGHIGVSQWVQIRVSHTKGMCLIHCAITTPKVYYKVYLCLRSWQWMKLYFMFVCWNKSTSAGLWIECVPPGNQHKNNC